MSNGAELDLGKVLEEAAEGAVEGALLGPAALASKAFMDELQKDPKALAKTMTDVAEGGLIGAAIFGPAAVAAKEAEDILKKFSDTRKK